MATYSAAIALANGELRVTRPHPAPQAVDDVVDQLLYTVREGGSEITSVALQIETDAAPPVAQDPLPGTAPEPDGGTHAADPLST